MKTVKVSFKNLSDFKSRICRLWQCQNEDEIYDFDFPDQETKDEFEKLTKCFAEGQ